MKKLVLILICIVQMTFFLTGCLVDIDDLLSEIEETNTSQTEEIPTLDEVKDELKEKVIQDKLTNEFIVSTLAKEREEAGFALSLPMCFCTVPENNEAEYNTIYQKTTSGHVIRNKPSKYLIDYLDRKEVKRLREDPVIQALMRRDYEKEIKKIRREIKND